MCELFLDYFVYFFVPQKIINRFENGENGKEPTFHRKLKNKM